MAEYVEGYFEKFDTYQNMKPPSISHRVHA